LQRILFIYTFGTNLNMKKLTILLFFIFSILTSFAQRNFLPGYIIFLTNDTASGQIDYRNWEKNPGQILFSRAGGEPQIYTIRDLQAFGVDGVDHYKKAIVSLDMNPVRIADVSRYNPGLVRTDTVFLRLLVSGNQVNLYEYVDFKPHFFVQPGNGTIEELNYRVTTDSTSTGIITYNDFRLQLKKLLSEHGLSYQQSMKIDKLDYKQKELVRFVSGINDPGAVYKTDQLEKAKSRPRLFAGGGIVFQNFGFDSKNNILNSLKFSSSVSYIITGGIDFFAARNLQNLVLRGEISLSQFETEGSGESSTPSTSTKQTNEYTLKQINITPAVTVLYNFMQFKKTKIYAGIGLGFNFSSYPKQRLTTTNQLTGVVSSYDDYLTLEKKWMGIYGKIGVIANTKIEIGITVQFDGTFVNFSQTGESSTPVSLRVFYRFN